MTKPVIAYIEDDVYLREVNDNPDRDALRYFLEKNCGCEVFLYRFSRQFENDILRIKKYFFCGRLILVIVKQEEHLDQHEEIIRIVRENLSPALPVVVIPDYRAKNLFAGSPGEVSVYASDYLDPKLIELVRNLAIEDRPLCDWLGADRTEGQAMLPAQLQNAYRTHTNDETALGTPEYNHMIVAEALRIKLLPAELLKAEFDDTLKTCPAIFSASPHETYEKELERIRKMNEEEREEFRRDLRWKIGEVSCGNDVNGFAIDPLTLETLITSSFGLHRMAGYLLKKRIELIETLVRRRRFGELDEEESHACRRRVMQGLIFKRVSGFETPILQLNTYPVETPQEVHRVGCFLRREKKFIPVDDEERIIGD